MERKLLVSGLNISYEGLFDSSDFFRLIEDWFRQNGYEKKEIKHVERVGEKGKFINFEVMPWKDINDYTRLEIYVRVIINDMVETKIKRKDFETKINKGKVSISIDAFLATDIRNRMESRPMYFFLRTIFDKFLHREYLSDVEKQLMTDVKNFHSELKAYLNLSRYSKQA